MNMMIIMSGLQFGPLGQWAPEFLLPTKLNSPIKIMNLIGPKGIRADSIILGTTHYHQTLTIGTQILCRKEGLNAALLPSPDLIYTPNLKHMPWASPYRPLV